MTWFGRWFGNRGGGSTPPPPSPYTFDTGLARPQRTLLRDGVVSLLSGLLVTNGGYLHAVIPYGGIVRGYTDEVGIDLLRGALNGRAPAVAVVCGDRQSSPDGIGAPNAKGDVDLAIYFYANFAGSLTEGRTRMGAAAIAVPTLDPGLEVMMEHVDELLLGQKVGGTTITNPVGEVSSATPSIKRIMSTREEELATFPEATIWVQHYAVTLARSVKPNRNVTQLLEEIRTVARNSDASLVGVDPDPAHPGAEVLDIDTTIP